MEEFGLTAGHGPTIIPSSLNCPYTGGRAKAWCLLIHAEASFSHGAQGESLEVPPYTRGIVFLSVYP